MKNNTASKRIIILIISILSFSIAFSQSKKQIKNFKIKTITETTTATNKEKNTPYVSNFVAYNKSSKPINKSEFSKDGSLIKKETATYDAEGNKIEETFFEMKFSLKKNFKTSSKFNSQGNKIEELESDGAGNVIRKQKFVYDHLNNKILEETFDGLDKLIGKVIYDYNGDGLKIMRQEFNGNNELVSEKKYQYTH